ncbi:hypothetical protein CJB45_003422 [Salmonella enterica]|nr:hypothetical protein [Salmonella enterica]EDJ7304509.1 hypothetical protein [Salmonella enterica]EDV2892715.1 hypothetical protein [Salmonella enterica subsp. diarizonae]EEJ1962620.1 hypothetical protein [Salmonella enterica]
MQETTTQILLYRLLFPVIASPPIVRMAQCERKKAARWINDKTQRDYSGRHKQKSPARWRGLNLFGRRLKLWRRYQIYSKCMLFN